MAIDWKSGIKIGLIMAAGQIIGKYTGKAFKLEENDIQTLENIGLGMGIAIGLNTKAPEKIKNKSLEKEDSKNYKFRNQITQEREKSPIRAK